MKKIFIAVLAVAAMASCATDEVVNAPKGAAIGFDETFVDNAVRANDLTATNLVDFNVFGTVEKGTKGIIFDGTLVNKTITNGELDPNGVWKYSGTQYWIPSARYYFVALAPATAAHWSYNYGDDGDAYSGIITFENGADDANGEQDILFADVTRTTATEIEANPAKVGFQFGHILSRIQFTFTNGFDESNKITLKVQNVVLEGLLPTGTVEVVGGETKTWAATGTPFNKTFGTALVGTDNIMAANANATTDHFYVIPTKVTYTVKFDVVLYQAGVEIDTYARQAEVTIDAQKGFSYDVKATLSAENVSDEDKPLKPIEFDVTGVNGWTEGSVDVTDDVEKIPAQGN